MVSLPDTLVESIQKLLLDSCILIESSNTRLIKLVKLAFSDKEGFLHSQTGYSVLPCDVCRCAGNSSVQNSFITLFSFLLQYIKRKEQAVFYCCILVFFSITSSRAPDTLRPAFCSVRALIHFYWQTLYPLMNFKLNHL